MNRDNDLQRSGFTFEGSRDGLLIAAFVGIAALAAADLWGDLRAGVADWHVFGEGLVVLVAATAALLLVRGLLARARDLDRRLATVHTEAAAWRREAESLIAGLGASIDGQFTRWQLSPAEKEVALLLLKGLAHKDIARMRGISEATARQQARAVYRKAGVGGRNDLAAFFLEDLALPAETRPPKDSV